MESLWYFFQYPPSLLRTPVTFRHQRWTSELSTYCVLLLDNYQIYKCWLCVFSGNKIFPWHQELNFTRNLALFEVSHLCCVQQSERPRTFADLTISLTSFSIVQSANVRGRSLCWTQHGFWPMKINLVSIVVPQLFFLVLSCRTVTTYAWL